MAAICTLGANCNVQDCLVSEERMSTGQWLGTVLCIPSSTLTLMPGWQEGYTPFHYSQEVVSQNRWRWMTCGRTGHPGSSGKTTVEWKY